jgi:putative membrane protein
MKFLIRMLISALVLFGVAYLSKGALLRVDTLTAAFYAAVVFAVVNAVIKPIVKLLAFPLTLMTLGLFSFVINALFFYLVQALVPGFHTVGFLQTMIAAVVVSVATSIAGWVARV